MLRKNRLQPVLYEAAHVRVTCEMLLIKVEGAVEEVDRGCVLM